MSSARARDCGPCTACCTFIPIETPGFYKPAGSHCLQCVEGIGCGIYPTRPQPCRDFLCGWRALAFLPDSLRPDLCGLIAVAEENGIPPGYADVSGVKFILVGEDAALARRDFLECLAGLVHARAPTFLAIPNPATGFFASAFLNRRLEAAAAARDAIEMEQIMAVTLASLRHAITSP